MKKKKRQGFAELQSECWISNELARCNFRDERHAWRLRKLLGQLSANIGTESPA
jgi:hypothetical protein